MDWLESIPKFDGDPSLVSAHIVMFTKIILDLYCDQDHIIIRLFLFSLEEKQRDWFIHYCNPRSISSAMALVREFLKHWGPGILKILFRILRMPFYVQIFPMALL